jgi:putative Ca2+/H+ antiporter (TMEM165/GDT1 family)
LSRFLQARSIYGLALLAFMVVGAGLQSYFAWTFWGSWGEEAGRWIWQIGGIACAWGTMFLLAAASELGAKKRAWPVRWVLLRPVAVLFLAFNLTCDIGAVQAHTSADEQSRSVDYARYSEAHAIVGDAKTPGRYDARIGALRTQLDARSLPRNSNAIRQKIETVEARIEARAAAGMTPQSSYFIEKGNLETALGWAKELEGLERRRATAQTTIEKFGAEPSTTRPQIAALRDAFALVGLSEIGERTIGLAFAAAFCVLIQLGVTAASIASPFLTVEPPRVRASDAAPAAITMAGENGDEAPRQGVKVVRLPARRAHKPKPTTRRRGATWEEARRLIDD